MRICAVFGGQLVENATQQLVHHPWYDVYQVYVSVLSLCCSHSLLVKRSGSTFVSLVIQEYIDWISAMLTLVAAMLAIVTANIVVEAFTHLVHYGLFRQRRRLPDSA